MANGVLVYMPTGAERRWSASSPFTWHWPRVESASTPPDHRWSNQKHGDLVRRYGPENIGLLTGDQSINGDAPVVVDDRGAPEHAVCGSQTLRALSFVVMDEVHFLADRMRRAVWEEVILHLPDDVRLVSLLPR